MNTTTRFFATKEQHKAFRIAFAAGQNDKRNRKTYTGEGENRRRHDGWMNSAHFLLFNLVTDRNYYNGFSPKTKTCFVENGGNPDRGIETSISILSDRIQSARFLLGLDEINVPSFYKDKKKFIAERTALHQRNVNAFLEPLGGVFTLQDLVRVQLPSFPGLTKEQIKEKVTYAQAYGEHIVDQTPDEDEVVEQVPEKKGFFKKLFGG